MEQDSARVRTGSRVTAASAALPPQLEVFNMPAVTSVDPIVGIEQAFCWIEFLLLIPKFWMF